METDLSMEDIITEILLATTALVPVIGFFCQVKIIYVSFKDKYVFMYSVKVDMPIIHYSSPFVTIYVS